MRFVEIWFKFNFLLHLNPSNFLTFHFEFLLLRISLCRSPSHAIPVTLSFTFMHLFYSSLRSWRWRCFVVVIVVAIEINSTRIIQRTFNWPESNHISLDILSICLYSIRIGLCQIFIVIVRNFHTRTKRNTNRKQKQKQKRFTRME